MILLERNTPEMTENSSFSKALPTLQLGIDSTSLGAFKTCPKYYQLSIVEGWEPKAERVHLVFGLLMHQAVERYEHWKVQGADHEEALDAALDFVLQSTWDKALQRPWTSDHNLKNRWTLIRSVVWYLDQFGQNDPIQTIVLANGKPAVELSFRFDSGYRSASTDEPFIFCGHLDRLGLLNDEPVIPDIKTTGSALNPKFFNGFSPGNQFSMYTLAGRVAFGQPVKKLVVDGAQIGVGFTRFQRQLVQRPDEVVSEWHQQAGWWLKMMESCAIAQDWPMNDRSCTMYGGCQYQGICSKPPSSREQWLKADFRKRVWDPLQIRGDI